MSDPKIGIYGGTFSPVHIGHIRSAYAFLNACGLERLFIMPAFIPPHKASPANDPQKRLEMLKLAFAPLPFYNDKIMISDYEIRQGGKSYTYLTLEHFRWITNDLTLLVGTDNFLTLEKWKNFETVFRLAKIAHVVRPENGRISPGIERAAERYEKLYGAKIISVPFAPVEISSTGLRKMISEGKDVSPYIPSEVREYIRLNGLYAEDDKK